MTLKTKMLAAGLALALTGFGLVLVSCSTPSGAKSTDLAGAPQPSVTSGATLWAQNCGHCHNTRSPDSFSDTQWDVAVLHMRVRANLTAEEHKQILAFLRSAH